MSRNIQDYISELKKNIAIDCLAQHTRKIAACLFLQRTVILVAVFPAINEFPGTAILPVKRIYSVDWDFVPVQAESKINIRRHGQRQYLRQQFQQ